MYSSEMLYLLLYLQNESKWNLLSIQQTGSTTFTVSGHAIVRYVVVNVGIPFIFCESVWSENSQGLLYYKSLIVMLKWNCLMPPNISTGLAAYGVAHACVNGRLQWRILEPSGQGWSHEFHTFTPLTTVCVWTISRDVKPVSERILFFQLHDQCFCKGLRFNFLNYFPAGGPSMYCVRWSNEAATVHADITADHRDVPANFTYCTFGMGRG